MLFQPSQGNFDGVGLSEAVFSSVLKTDLMMWRPLFKSILLSGATTMLPGFSTRLRRDLTELVLNKIRRGNQSGLKFWTPKVESSPWGKCLAYFGGTIWTEICQQKRQAWAWQNEFREKGSDGIISRWQSLTERPER
jgi:actin-related protein 2